MPSEPLSVAFPELAAQAYGWDPALITAGSGKKKDWQCRHGHIWEASPNMRTSKNPPAGCPVCSFRRLSPGVNDLGTTDPEIAATLLEENPNSVTRISRKVVSWQCKKGHVWQASVSNRVGVNNPSRSPIGCPFCGGREVLPGFNDLATTHPELANEADGWNPASYSMGSHDLVAWKCSQGHSWVVSINSRTNNKSNCPFCAGSRVVKGKSDLKTKFPSIASEAHGWDPSETMAFSKAIKTWKCSSGHIFKMVIGNRTGQGQGCPFCAGKKVLAGFNDLQTKYPEIAAEAHGWDPATLSWGSHKFGEWICEEGHIWRAVVANRTVLGQGCPGCASSGFDPNKQAWIYLLTHSEWNLNQVGISNVIENRLSTHRRLGWELVDLRGPLAGDLAYQWEQAIIRTLKRLGADFSFDQQLGKFTGFTESWTIASFHVTKIFDLMQQVEAMGE